MSSTIIDTYGLPAYWSWHHHRVGPASPRGRPAAVWRKGPRWRPHHPSLPPVS
jgi:hypothetical protein